MEITNVIGTPCLNTSYKELLDILVGSNANDETVVAVDFTNIHIVTARKLYTKFHSITQHYNYFVPDSQILKWAVNLRGGSMRDRVYGPEFLKYTIMNSPEGIKHYFLGGSQDCLEKLIANIKEKNSSFNICGSHNGYFDTSQEESITERIVLSKANFVWVGLGTPKQQEWIWKHRDKLSNCIILAVGFAFDVNAGTKKDAPKWMQKLGLTWLYRLCEEPKRLWKRYFKYNSLFILFFLKELVTEGLKTVLPGKKQDDVVR